MTPGQSAFRSVQLLVVLALTALARAEGPAAPNASRTNSEPPRAIRFQFGGAVGERIEANLQQWLLTAPRANPGMLEMFRTRDRKPEPELVPWAGEFVGKYLLSAIQARRMIASEELDATIRQVVDELIAAQADDGYLGPFRKDERLLGQWDLWGHYHVMLALMMYHEDVSCEPAMRACTRAADLICRTYLDGTCRVYDAGSHEMNMAVIHAMARLYRVTGNARFLQMVRHIEQDWQRAGDYLRTGAAGIPFHRTPRPRWESLHDLQGLAELYRITGEEPYRRALVNHWQSIARFDRHNSGSFSTGEGAIGNPYLNGAIETCCTTAWMALTIDYLQLTGESIAADELEWSTYNAVLGSQHPTGRWWTYDTPMDGVRRASAHSIVFQARPGTPELNCCSVNGPRGLSMLAEWAVQVDADGPIVNHYGPGRASFELADGTGVTLTQRTGYPADGEISLVVEVSRPTRFNLRLRIPNWSKRTSIALDGKPKDGVRPGSYFSIPGEWRQSSTIHIALDMKPRYWLGECEQAGRASVYQGPLLLAFDPHYNDIDAPELTALDLGTLALTPAEHPAAHAPFAPLALREARTAAGKIVRLCDFATAGAYGNPYVSWLPATNGQPGNDWLTYAPSYLQTEVFRTDPEGVLTASLLDGSGDPAPGKLQKAQSVESAADRFGRADGAVEFNGRDSRLQYEVPGFPREFTVTAWVMVHEFSSKMYQQVFSAWSGAMSDPLRLSIMGETLSARIEAGAVYATSGIRLETGRWYHVAAVRSADRLDLYLDGRLAATVNAPACPCGTSRSFALGANPAFEGDEYFSGRIDAFSLYARALSESDIGALSRGEPR